MKTRNRFLFLAPLAAALALAALASAALRAGEETAPDRKGPGRRGDGPPPEAREYHEKALKVYDANNDGKLDEDERAIMREDIEAGKFPPPPRGAPGGPRGGLPKEILEKYDTDKDGKLNETERAALEADIKAGKIQPPPHRGPRGDRKDGPPPAPPAEASGT